MLGTTNASSKSGGSTETITITASLASGCDFGIIVGGTPITSSGTYTVPKYSLCTISSKEFWTWVNAAGSGGATDPWTAPTSHSVSRYISLFGTIIASASFTSVGSKEISRSTYVNKVLIADTFLPFSTSFEVASNITITVTETGTAGKLTVTNS